MLYIHWLEAFEKLTSIEGKAWAVQQGAPNCTTGFFQFLAEWKENYAPHFDLIGEHASSIPIRVGDNALYGNGGYNRYLVLASGEIVFHASFCELPTKYRPLVEAAEIRVVGNWKNV